MTRVLKQLFQTLDVELSPYFEEDDARALYAAAATAEVAESICPALLVKHKIRKFKKHALQLRSQALQREVLEAEREQNTFLATQLAQERFEIERKIHEIGAT